MYDTVWENKCQNVSLTVAQRDCDTTEEIVRETECRVVNETVLRPLCITTVEKVVEEVRV